MEGLILVAPLAVWALWQHRREGFFAGVIWYVIGLHVAMSIVFTFPGTRGGLFHSSVALYPFWVVTGLVGLEDVVSRLARWRKWRTGEAQLVFGSAMILLPIALGWFAWNAQAKNRDSRPDYEGLAENLPEDARIMVNDPAAW
ncbi:MAG TPA: hypothetical protein VJZ27_10750, partial [Aggregatilineales bacterium]|nr:hypothetical protein [Aggregatilineales bacterium]